MTVYSLSVNDIDGAIIVRIPHDGEPQYGPGVNASNVAQKVYDLLAFIGRRNLAAAG